MFRVTKEEAEKARKSGARNSPVSVPKKKNSFQVGKTYRKIRLKERIPDASTDRRPSSWKFWAEFTICGHEDEISAQALRLRVAKKRSWKDGLCGACLKQKLKQKPQAPNKKMKKTEIDVDAAMALWKPTK